MIEVFDTEAARSALARRMLRCPDCGQALKPWGQARQRAVRERGGALVTVVPDRAQCTGCGGTHVVLDAGLLPGFLAITRTGLSPAGDDELLIRS